jgi:granule-bound starch synthase
LWWWFICKIIQGPAKNWENVLLSLGVAGGEPGIEGEEIAPLAKENVAAP